MSTVPQRDTPPKATAPVLIMPKAPKAPKTSKVTTQSPPEPSPTTQRMLRSRQRLHEARHRQPTMQVNPETVTGRANHEGNVEDGRVSRLIADLESHSESRQVAQDSAKPHSVNLEASMKAKDDEIKRLRACNNALQKDRDSLKKKQQASSTKFEAMEQRAHLAESKVHTVQSQLALETSRSGSLAATEKTLHRQIERLRSGQVKERDATAYYVTMCHDKDYELRTSRDSLKLLKETTAKTIQTKDTEITRLRRLNNELLEKGAGRQEAYRLARRPADHEELEEKLARTRGEVESLRQAAEAAYQREEQLQAEGAARNAEVTRQEAEINVLRHRVADLEVERISPTAFSQDHVDMQLREAEAAAERRALSERMKWQELKSGLEARVASLHEQLSLTGNTNVKQVDLVKDLRKEMASLQSRLQIAEKDSLKARQTSVGMSRTGSPSTVASRTQPVNEQELMLRDELETQLVTVKTALAKTQQQYDDSLREVSRLREQARASQAQLPRSGTKHHRMEDDSVHHLREESARLRLQVDAEMGDKRRLQVAYDKAKGEVQRLQEESNSLRVFLNQNDNHSAAEILRDLDILNSRCSHLANSLAMQWEDEVFMQDSELHERDAILARQTDARRILQQPLGDTFFTLLCQRLAGPGDEKNATLVLFALQACAIHCVEEVFSSFCFGCTDETNSMLERIYRQLHQNESQALSSRWKSLAHSYARSSFDNYETIAKNLISERLATHMTALYHCVSGQTGEDFNLGEFYASELNDISAAAISLSVKVKEEIMSTTFDIFIGRPGEANNEEVIEDVLRTDKEEDVDSTVMCALEMGLLQSTRKAKVGWSGGSEPTIERMILLRAKVITDTSVQNLLED